MPRSPLHALHERLGARFTEFGGWTMPVRYAGTIVEHEAVRTSAGVFDVSHLGRFRYEGPGCLDVLRGELCNDVTRIGPGRAQYTMALNDAGGIVDDVIVWWVDEERFEVLPNGVNHERILHRLAGAGGPRPRSDRERTVLLAVQGPHAPRLVTDVLGDAPRRFGVMVAEHAGASVVVAGTGYTGEPGAEIMAPVEVGIGLFEAFVAAGAAPCGLGARDTLRLEMGYPLWGQDLDEDTTPLEADLEWVVSWDHDFVGRAALERQRREGPRKRLVGFVTEGRRAIPRHGHRLRGDGSTGIVTSGTYSPTLGHGIGMGYLAPPAAPEVVEVEIRGAWVPARRRDPPFLTP